MIKDIHLPAHELCTGCGVCEKVCPTKSIRIKKDEMDCQYPQIDDEICIKCGSCLKHCHILNNPEKRIPNTVYAAWNTSDTERKTSASGGIATAMYYYALQHGISSYGVKYEIHKNATYIPIHSTEDIVVCKNSKYVSSECVCTFGDIKTNLSSGNEVIFVGLPCHVSALKSYLGRDYDNLILIDIICHGVAPVDYLNQHIESIERKKKKEADSLFFRDPQYGTENFHMSFINANKRFYSALPKGGDTYSTGYHTALIYRENCYHCKYATQERITDITIGDFSGLGRFAPWLQTKVGVSCILVSTEKGHQLINRLMDLGLIHCEERPPEEAFKVEKQLMHPSIPHKNREFFKTIYSQCRDFEKSTKGLLCEDIRVFRKAIVKKNIRRIASKIVPQNIKMAGKRFLNKIRRIHE